MTFLDAAKKAHEKMEIMQRKYLSFFKLKKSKHNNIKGI